MTKRLTKKELARLAAQYTVAFGTEWPEEFSTSVGAYEYLDQQFTKHQKGCFSVDGPLGRWSGYLVYDMWIALAGCAEKFDAFYDIVGDRQGA